MRGWVIVWLIRGWQLCQLRDLPGRPVRSFQQLLALQQLRQLRQYANGTLAARTHGDIALNLKCRGPTPLFSSWGRMHAAARSMRRWHVYRHVQLSEHVRQLLGRQLLWSRSRILHQYARLDALPPLSGPELTSIMQLRRRGVVQRGVGRRGQPVLRVPTAPLARVPAQVRSRSRVNARNAAWTTAPRTAIDPYSVGTGLFWARLPRMLQPVGLDPTRLRAHRDAPVNWFESTQVPDLASHINTRRPLRFTL